MNTRKNKKITTELRILGIVRESFFDMQTVGYLASRLKISVHKIAAVVKKSRRVKFYIGGEQEKYVSHRFVTIRG